MKNKMRIKLACVFVLVFAAVIGGLLPLAVRADTPISTPTPQQSPLDLPAETATPGGTAATEIPGTPAPTSTPKPVCAATITEFEARQATRWEAVAIIGTALTPSFGGLL